MSWWRIVLDPRGPGDRHDVYLVNGDRGDAVLTLDLIADGIKNTGVVPDMGFDVRSQPGCAVTRERSPNGAVYGIRCDSFERETDNGMTSGAGYLRAEEVPAE